MAIWFSLTRRASRDRLAAKLFLRRRAQYFSSFRSSGTYYNTRGKRQSIDSLIGRSGNGRREQLDFCRTATHLFLGLLGHGLWAELLFGKLAAPRIEIDTRNQGVLVVDVAEGARRRLWTASRTLPAPRLLSFHHSCLSDFGVDQKRTQRRCWHCFESR
jgi:hypothetical protein